MRHRDPPLLLASSRPFDLHSGSRTWIYPVATYDERYEKDGSLARLCFRYYASTMLLQLMSDASYLCRPKARSVYGTHAYLGEENVINGPIACASKMITSVVASAAEAELAGGFRLAQDAVQYRRILVDLGYPQPPTLLRIDNTVAIGIA